MRNLSTGVAGQLDQHPNDLYPSPSPPHIKSSFGHAGAHTGQIPLRSTDGVRDANDSCAAAKLTLTIRLLVVDDSVIRIEAMESVLSSAGESWRTWQ